MKTGDILFCSGKKLLSKLIRLFTKSEWSHTALFIEIWGQPYIIDAQKNGINVKEFNEWVKEYGYKYEVRRSPKLIDEHTFSLKAMSKSGVTLYDFESLIIRQPLYLITRKWEEKKSEDERMYCSEYVAWCHDVPEWFSMSPQDLYEYCLINKWDKK